MNITLLKVVIVLFSALLLLSGSIALLFRFKTVYAFLQSAGAACLTVVVLTHICEALGLFPGMHWGLEHSPGHYLDLASALLGITLFPLGYFLHAFVGSK